MTISSPLTLGAGVRGLAMFIGSEIVFGRKAKVVSSSSSSLGVSSRCVSSWTASSGYRPRSITCRGVCGNSDPELSSRWNAASDLTSASRGRASSASKLRIRCCLGCATKISHIYESCVMRHALGATSAGEPAGLQALPLSRESGLAVFLGCPSAFEGRQ